ncbi:hypothetical protein GBA52_023590 [Prunus armeniaca]|nr:hypothetical protein GBA52_023590 [Prunus armeniaca]
MYSSTHFGISDLDGISKNRSGDEDDDDDEFEFLRRRSTAASLQNSTHLGVLPPDPKPVSRLLREKLVDDPADFSLTDLCFLRIYGSESDFRNKDSRSKKSDRSNPQQKIRFSSTKKMGFPAKQGLQGM